MIEVMPSDPVKPVQIEASVTRMVLQARSYSFLFPQPTLIMGILNVTPDSFSDGGLFLDPQAAVDHALELVAEGADILDIGGESTRPSALPVSEPEELRRVMPVLEKLVEQLRIPLSIDTTKPGVARAALQAGASMVNDVGSNLGGAAMWPMVAETGAAYVLMHSKGTPQTMQQQPAYENLTAEVSRFFDERMIRLLALGVRAEQILLDVGIGFGKTVEHNLALLGGLDRFRRWERPLLLGVSRKSFIGAVAGVPEARQRLPGSLACACWGVQHGANIIRVHDVAATRQAARMIEAMQPYAA